MESSMKPLYLKIAASAIALYLMSAASSFAIFSAFKPASIVGEPIKIVVDESGGLVIDPGEPKTEICPLNGARYTMTERTAWEQVRPLAIMVENSVDSRPQSGLSQADIVYEAVAEGGITRFMALFYCDAIATDVTVAPVRSARTYFVDWASEYNRPIYSHVGGANCSADPATGRCMSDPRTMAIEQIKQYGWQLTNDVDGMSVGLPVYYRDGNRLGRDRVLATEHTMVTSTSRLWTFAATRKWTATDPTGNSWQAGFVGWDFVDEATSANRGPARSIAYDFWSGYKQFDVVWQYNPSSNDYLRSMGGEPHLDLNNKQQITVKNVVVIKTDEIGPVDPLKHMLYTTIGKGEALVFQDGQVIEAIWSKASRTDRTVFTDKSGKEIKFVRGPIWLSVINKKNVVAY